MSKENRPGWLIRPLLNVHRSEIEAYLRQNDLAWREDGSNTEMRFSRNFMRHQILPQLATINPKVVDALARTAEIAAADVDRLADMDRALLAGLDLTSSTIDEISERVVLNYGALRGLGRAEQRGVLRAAIDRLPGGIYGIDSASVDRLLDVLNAGCTSDGVPATSGPHPLIDDLAWSFVSSRKQVPSRLIIHLAGAMPVQPWGPQLDATWTPTRCRTPAN